MKVYLLYYGNYSPCGDGCIEGIYSDLQTALDNISDKNDRYNNLFEVELNNNFATAKKIDISKEIEKG